MNRTPCPSPEHVSSGEDSLGVFTHLRPPETEETFYQGYSWCLQLYPTIEKAVEHLGSELGKLKTVREDWQIAEVMTNVFLLSCALSNAVDEYLRGSSFQLPKKAPAVPFFRHVCRAMEMSAAILRMRRRARARRWRAAWRAGLDAFLPLLVGDATPDPAVLAATADTLDRLLRSPLPADLQREHVFFPSAFRKHDLTHFDVLALGRRFIDRFPDRQRPILLVGLRSAGSYFAPLLRALLRAQGYPTVDTVTVRPEKGPGAAEHAELIRCARAGCLAVIVDDSPRSGDALVAAVDIVRQAGFSAGAVAVLVPVHPASRDWRQHVESISLSDTTMLTLEGEEWHKVGLLDAKEAEGRISEYFSKSSSANVRLIAVTTAEHFGAQLQSASEDPRRARLKRVYEVDLRHSDGQMERAYVLAKSVGWGWLGYPAFLVGRRLSGRVPPVLGLRDGILYTLWLPPVGPASRRSDSEDREQWIERTASYVAARVRSLGLGQDPTPTLGLHPHHDGIRLLDRVLSRAYGSALAANMMRPSLRRRLIGQPCPRPTLIDGKMERSEWVAGPEGLVKTDFEHHGMGKNELNMVDPAYDLAESILRLSLSPQEESRLIRLYTEESGDADVEKRLFLNKLLAGMWVTASALKALFRRPPLLNRQPEFHRSFIDAWHFLTVHAARFCGKHCQPTKAPCWRDPLVVLDIDGVLDRRIFGFPCTTAAGIEALALLHAHDFAVAVDTARSALEVKEYCQAYGLVGGVAEYGAYAWDAVNGRGRVLVSPESLAQMDRLREALRQHPGVFLDDRYQHSVRACTYESRAGGRSFLSSVLGTLPDSPYDGKYPQPLPTLAVRQVLTELGLNRLRVHQTTIDTTIVAGGVDKGHGLLGLLELAGRPGAETIAVGDSEPDLPMFRVATRCFAPAHIGCARLARSLGCRIARQPFQRGLLDIVRSIVSPDGGRRPSRARLWQRGQDLFLDLLEAADWKRPTALLRALLDPAAYQVFLR